MLRTRFLCFIAAALCCAFPQESYAAKKKKPAASLCAQPATGAIVTRAKCKKTEKKLNLTDLGSTIAQTFAGGTQGPQGPQGAQGPAGPQGIQGVQGVQGAAGAQGAPGSFSLNGCLQRSSAIANAAAGAVATATVTCQASEFLVSSGVGMAPIGSSVNKPYIQSKVLILDVGNKFPVGVSYSSFQAVSNGNAHSLQTFAICCQRQ